MRALVLKYQDYLMPEPPQGEGPDKNGEKPDMKKPGNKKPGTDSYQGKRQEYEKKLKKILTDDQINPIRRWGLVEKEKPQRINKEAETCIERLCRR